MFPKLVGKNGSPVVPREWQAAAFEVATDRWLGGHGAALLNVCPGGGKTLLGIAMAKFAIMHNMADRIVVVTPRKAICAQWAQLLQGRHAVSRQADLQKGKEDRAQSDGGVKATLESVMSATSQNEVQQNGD